MVGDSITNDILPCAKLNMTCIWFKSRPYQESKLKKIEKQISDFDNIFIVNNLNDASVIIKGIIKKK